MDNKTFIDALNKATSVSKKDLTVIISALQDALGETLADGNCVAIAGFGTFEPRKRAERVVVIPGSSKRVLVPPKQVVTLRPATSLRNKLQQS